MRQRRTVYISGKRVGVVRKLNRRRRKLDWLVPMIFLALFGIGSGSLWCAVFLPVVAHEASAEGAKPAGPKPLSAALAGGPAAAPLIPAEPTPSAEGLAILQAAEAQLAAGVSYSADYFQLAYPMGDVPAHLGTSADLVVRALRAAHIDLQVEIQKDREEAPEAYPTKRWKRIKADRNVDHRRLANIKAWLDRHADLRTTRIHPEGLRDYLPGDIVMWSLRDGRVSPDHAGIVSREKGPDGAPLAIDLHPKVGVVAKKHAVDKWGVRGHYRLPAAQVPEANRPSVPPPSPSPPSVDPPSEAPPASAASDAAQYVQHTVR